MAEEVKGGQVTFTYAVAAKVEEVIKQAETEAKTQVIPENVTEPNVIPPAETTKDEVEKKLSEAEVKAEDSLKDSMGNLNKLESTLGSIEKKLSGLKD